MSDPLDLVVTGAGGAGGGVGLFLLGRAALEWVRQRQPSSSLRAPRSPSPPPTPRCAPVVEEQVAELHGLVARRDPATDGYLLLSELAAMRALLAEIRDAVTRPRMPSSPGE